MPEQQQSVAGPPNQLNIFPHLNGSSHLEVPDDVKAALDIVTGANGLDQFLGSPPKDRDDEPLSRLHPDFKGSKYELLKKGDRVAKQVHYEDPKVKVFDISDQVQADEMAAILARVGDPENGMGFAETPPATLIDTNSPRGFRVIVTVRWWKMRVIVKPLSEEATGLPEPKA